MPPEPRTIVHAVVAEATNGTREPAKDAMVTVDLSAPAPAPAPASVSVSSFSYPGAKSYGGKDKDLVDKRLDKRLDLDLNLNLNLDPNPNRNNNCIEAQVIAERSKQKQNEAATGSFATSNGASGALFFETNGKSKSNRNRNGKGKGKGNQKDHYRDSEKNSNSNNNSNNNNRGFSFSRDWYFYSMVAMTLIFLALLGYGFGSGLFLSSPNTTKNGIPAAATTKNHSGKDGAGAVAAGDGDGSSSTSALSNNNNNNNNIRDRRDYRYSIERLVGLPEIMERTSPQSQALDWLAYEDEPLFDLSKETTESESTTSSTTSTSSTSTTTSEEEDRYKEILEQRYALVVWYYDQGGPTVWKTINREESAGWIAFGAGVHECDWKGVDCDYNGNNDDRSNGNNNNDAGIVVGLRLSPALGLLMTGTSLSTELGLLTALRRIEPSFSFCCCPYTYTCRAVPCRVLLTESVVLSKNQLQTTIPEWIGRSAEDGGGWSNLEQLVLDGNSLYGSLPSSMSNLSKLTRLELQVNPQLEGRFDQIFFYEDDEEDEDEDEDTDEDTEEDTDSRRFPGENLELLDLSNTGLKGKIPRMTLPSINSFRMWNMPNFWGTLPREIGTWSNLETFSVKEMPGLTGTLPTQFGNLEKLKTLEVLDSNFMSGALPTELGKLSLLKTINFRYANQTGTLPTEWSGLVHLETINLMQNNLLTGTIPTEYAQMTSLRSIDLRGTDLSGEVSQEICAIESIREFQADCSYKNDKNVGKIVCVCCVWCHNS